MIINLFTKQFYDMGQKCIFENFENIFTQSDFGLSFCDRTLVQVMGKQDAGQFLKKRDEHYDEWRYSQFSNPNFPIDNLNELLREAGQEKTTLHLKRFEFRIMK